MFSICQVVADDVLFPLSQNALSTYCFVFFACICGLGGLYTFFLLPETKGKTFLEISRDFEAITVCGKSFMEKGVETKYSVQMQ